MRPKKQGILEGTFNFEAFREVISLWRHLGMDEGRLLLLRLFTPIIIHRYDTQSIYGKINYVRLLAIFRIILNVHRFVVSISFGSL